MSQKWQFHVAEKVDFPDAPTHICSIPHPLHAPLSIYLCTIVLRLKNTGLFNKRDPVLKTWVSFIKETYVLL